MEQTAPDVPAILGHATERLEVATGTFLPDVREVALEANDQRNGVVDDAVGVAWYGRGKLHHYTYGRLRWRQRPKDRQYHSCRSHAQDRCASPCNGAK